jgi:hypothetical protein
MAMLAIAVPILPGKTEQWRRMMDEVKGPRAAEIRAVRARVGVHERTFLQSTPHGDLVVITLEGNDPAAAFAAMHAGADATTQWFVTQVREIHGIDLTQPPPGPPPALVFDSQV